MGGSGRKRVLVTGSAGGIGTMFLEFARDLYDFACFDRRPTPGVPDAAVGNLTDLAALEKAAFGCDAVVHLGAYPSNRGEFLSMILPNNFIGTYNAYEAAARAGARKFVFASSVQADYGYPDDMKLGVEMPANPDSFYGASKTYGEYLGRVYSRRRGLSVVCIRFGMVVTPRAAEWLARSGQIPDPEVVTGRDTCGIIRSAIEVEGVDFAVIPGFSRNGEKIRDLSPVKDVLGYELQDDAFEIWGKRD